MAMDGLAFGSNVALPVGGLCGFYRRSPDVFPTVPRSGSGGGRSSVNDRTLVLRRYIATLRNLPTVSLPGDSPTDYYGCCGLPLPVGMVKPTHLALKNFPYLPTTALPDGVTLTCVTGGPDVTGRPATDWCI